MIGGKLASMAGSALGLELEGLSNEDREFEVARRLVRIGQHATRHLAGMPPTMPPARAARIAFLRAARQVAPGLLPAMRAIARQGAVAARQNGVSPLTYPRYYTGYNNGYTSGNGGAVVAQGHASCPSCGNALPRGAGVPQSGYWRRSRNGRALILMLAPHRTAY
jgi:hypothetical protein